MSNHIKKDIHEITKTKGTPSSHSGTASSSQHRRKGDKSFRSSKRPKYRSQAQGIPEQAVKPVAPALAQAHAVGQAGNPLDDERLHITAKIAALGVSSCVVKVISHYKHDDTVKSQSERKRHGFFARIGPFGDWVKYFTGSGIIIECEEANDGTYFSTVLTHANLFVRRHCAPIQPNEIEVDVSLLDGKLYKSEILACDFHYNLAVVRIATDTPLQPANIRSLDDTMSIDPTQQSSLNLEKKSSQLRPHSNLFKFFPGDKVIALARQTERPWDLYIDCGNFSIKRSSLDCEELYCVRGISGNDYNGGPVINYSGEMIGIMFHESSFLPSNIISRWWKHYKSYREFRRPWIGFRVANLYTAHVGFLEQLIQNFPGVSTGVLVQEVEQDSPAYCSGIRELDVIIQFNGVAVQSTLEFFEKTWDKVGDSVELKVLRASTGGQLNLTTTIGEVTPDKFYRWLPGYKEILGYE